MVSGDRQRVIETNRSLRLIKNELESLLEKGVITDDVFDSITRQLPSESGLAGPPTPAQRATGLPTPAPTASPSPSSPPTNAMSNLAILPPSYNQSTGGAGGPPPLPGRNQPPPPPPPSKPILCHAKALYKYAASDARDCSFERDDRIAVHEYMNADWWMGCNLRTGLEGIFPKSYVEVEAAPPPPPPAGNGYVDEKAGGYPGAVYQPPAQPQYGGYPPPPAQQNPYNSNVPPMAVAEQGSGSGGAGQNKIAEGGKKFGKKLGNAAIFGAGATIGSNIVNSIF